MYAHVEGRQRVRRARLFTKCARGSVLMIQARSQDRVELNGAIIFRVSRQGTA